MLSGKKFATKLLPIVAALLTIMLAACGGGTGQTAKTHTAAAQNKQVLVSGAEVGTADILSFDPALVPDAFSGSAINNVFTGLIGLNDKLQLVPEMATSLPQISNNGTTYTFTLKPGLKFSDGAAVTAQDVVYSINRALEPATKSSTGPYYLHYIKDSGAVGTKGGPSTLVGDSLLAPNPTTVEIITDKFYPFFEYALTYPTSDVVEPSLVQKYGTNWTDHLTEGGGDGPWMVKSYQHSKQIVFVPNPYYYGPHPKLQELIYPFYQQADSGYPAYLANQLDSVGIPSQFYAQDKSRPDFVQFPILAINYYTMNYRIKPFDNIDIRQAFELAINKDLIVKDVWHDQFIATNHIVPQGQPGYDPNLTGPDGVKGTAGDTTLAKQLFQTGMQQEGYTSVSQIPPITLTYSSAGAQAAKNEVAVMQQEWQTVLGVNVKTDDININTLFTDEGLGSKNPLMFYDGPAWIADYPDAQDWTSLQFCDGCGQNGMNYGQNNSSDAAAQQQVQQELVQADGMSLGAARNALYNKAEQQLVNDVAWFPMEQQQVAALQKPCVQGIVNNGQNFTPPDDWGNIYISTDTPCVNATVQ